VSWTMAFTLTHNNEPSFGGRDPFWFVNATLKVDHFLEATSDHSAPSLCQHS
jgi:hypothetical protein